MSILPSFPELVGPSPVKPPVVPAPAPTPAVDDDAVWATWKAAGPSPKANALALQDLDPLVTRAAASVVGGKGLNPILKGRARRLALDGLKTFDPAKGKLQTHMYNQMRTLKRISARSAAGVAVPERIALDRRALDMASTELEDELGREPTDDELADRVGMPPTRIRRVRSYRPAIVGGRPNQDGGINDDPASQVPGKNMAMRAMAQMVYDDLSPSDQKVFEWSGGFGGPLKDVTAIASGLRRSIGWVSQRRALIQKLLDEAHQLNPF